MKRWGGGPSGRAGGPRGGFGGSRATCRRGAGVGGGNKNIRRMRSGSVQAPLFTYPDGCRASAPLFGFMGHFAGAPGSGMDGWYNQTEATRNAQSALVASANMVPLEIRDHNRKRAISDPTLADDSSVPNGGDMSSSSIDPVFYWNAQLDIPRLTFFEVLIILMDLGWSPPPLSWFDGWGATTCTPRTFESWTPVQLHMDLGNSTIQITEEEVGKDITNSSSPSYHPLSRLCTFTSPLSVLQFFRYVLVSTSKLKLSHGALMKISPDRIIHASRAFDGERTYHQVHATENRHVISHIQESDVGGDPNELRLSNRCENCLRNHDGLYGSGRFCSVACRSRFNGRSRKPQVCTNIHKYALNYFLLLILGFLFCSSCVYSENTHLQLLLRSMLYIHSHIYSRCGPCQMVESLLHGHGHPPVSVSVLRQQLYRPLVWRWTL
jgi:hypothetical protein